MQASCCRLNSPLTVPARVPASVPVSFSGECSFPHPLTVKMHFQLGQAMVEFILALFVLMPLLLIIPLLGKYLDLAHVTTLASRFAAFEASVRHGSSTHGWATAEQLSDELRTGLYKLPARSTTSTRSGSAEPLWYEHRGRPLISTDAASLNVSASHLVPSGLARPRFADDLGLADGHLFHASVSLRVNNIADLTPFDELDLRIERHSALLVDSWAAANSAAVVKALQRRPGKLTGHFPYQPLQSLLTPIKPFIRILEGEHAPTGGEVSPDVVPEDRIR